MKKKFSLVALSIIIINILVSTLFPVYAAAEINAETKEIVSTSSSNMEIMSNEPEVSEAEESTDKIIDSSETTETIESTETTGNSELNITSDSINLDNDSKEKSSIGLSQGPYIKFDKYITVVKNNFYTYKNFEWDTYKKTTDINGQTFLAKGKYEHGNGKVYYSIFDNKDKWYGYIEDSAVKIADGKQGAYIWQKKYVTISNSNYSTYQNFSWKKLNATSSMYLKTYEVRAKYSHFDGDIYYSLYDNNGKWQGYLSTKAVTEANGKQGIYQAYGKYVTLTDSKYPTYQNFSWKVLNSGQKVNYKTYYAKGLYRHFDGNTYLTVYDSKGKWQGYVNEAGTKKADGPQGIYQNNGKYVTITKNNYSTYRNFSWSKLNNTKNLYGNTYLAKGKYQHYNGATYLSLFDSNGKWYGYVNANATITSSGPQGVYQSLNRHVIIKSGNYNMWQNFNWKLKQKSTKFYNKGLVARGKYKHFNGSTYYTVYDGDGNWQGYINSGGARLVSYQHNPTAYYSQMAIGAWNGCAATSLYTVLRAKGYAKNVTLVNFINGLPLSDSNPDVGQIGDPWGKTPFKRVISPIGLNNYAKKYTNTSQVITGSSTDKVITEINSGNYVLYWGMWKMQEPNVTKNPQHVMIAKGYKVENGKEYILIQDPGLFSSSDPLAVRWYEKNAFDSYVAKKYRKMMVVR